MNVFIKELESKDDVMGALIKRLPKYNVTNSSNPFTDLIRSIISQQLSAKAASTIYSRFIDLIGNEFSAINLHLISNEELKSVGISGSKCNYIKNVAEKLIDEPNYFSKFENSSDEEVLIEITKIKGIGIWTAQMFLMFSLGRLDVLPTADVGIQNAVQKYYQLDSKPNVFKLQEIAIKWQPYRTIGCWYLWQALDSKIEL